MQNNKDRVLEQVFGKPIDLVDWRKRMKEGFIVELKIKRWRARKKLTLSELGIQPPSYQTRTVYEELIALGSKLLLPQQTLNELDAIERGARMHLSNFTFDTPFGMFIPYTSYAQWKKGNEQFKERFYAKRDEIVFAYPDLVEQILNEYDLLAKHTYQLLTTQDEELLQTFPYEEAFLQHFRTEVIARYIKSAKEFAETFIYDEQFSRIDLLTIETEDIDVTEADTIVNQKKEEVEAAQKRRILLEEMNRDLVQKAKAQKQQMIDGFLSSLIVQLRTLTYEVVTSVLASIKQQETLQGRPALQLKNLVEKIKEMNFYGDEDIDGILTAIYGIIEKPPKERNISEITRQLKAIAMVTRSTILALGESSRETRDGSQTLEGSPIPSVEEVREAREELTVAIANYRITESDREEREERQDLLLVPLVIGETRAERE